MIPIKNKITKLTKKLKRKRIINSISEGLFGKINLKPVVYKIDSILKDYPFDKKHYKYMEQLIEFYSKVRINWNSSNSFNKENLSTHDFRYRLGLILDLLQQLINESQTCLIGLFEFKNVLNDINLLKEKDTEEFVEFRGIVIKLAKIYSKCFQINKTVRELKQIKIKYNRFIPTEKIEKLKRITKDCIEQIAESEENAIYYIRN